MEIQSIGTPSLWIGFIVFVIAMLAIDLGIFHRKAHAVNFKEAISWSVVWISLALLFNLGVYHWFGTQKAIEFFTGYLVEKSLSVDNIFVFIMVFNAFAIPSIYQHRILFWGILGALLMRAGMIFAGAELLLKFHWIIYVFGGFLILTGIKMLFDKGKEIHPDKNTLVRWMKKIIPITDRYHGQNFFIIQNGKRFATPLFLVLILIEITDLIFAVDSIPAIFAITTDPFIVFTSNIFAILGLRSLYFALGGIVDKFIYLKIGLATVLMFVGVKMSIVDIYKLDSLVSLGIITSILGISIIASLIKARSQVKQTKKL